MGESHAAQEQTGAVSPALRRESALSARDSGTRLAARRAKASLEHQTERQTSQLEPGLVCATEFRFLWFGALRQRHCGRVGKRVSVRVQLAAQTLFEQKTTGGLVNAEKSLGRASFIAGICYRSLDRCLGVRSGISVGGRRSAGHTTEYSIRSSTQLNRSAFRPIRSADFWSVWVYRTGQYRSSSGVPDRRHRSALFQYGYEYRADAGPRSQILVQ